MNRITGECPRCRVITRHRLIGAGIYRCLCCGHTHEEHEIRAYSPPSPGAGHSQKELFEFSCWDAARGRGD
jgi:ribosomal protein L37AE/L43A